MNTTIFYFSATGNSLHFAQQLANELKTAKLVSIAEAMEWETIETGADRIGLVFPVYAWGAPRIVMDFLQKLAITGKPYIFSIATCVGIPAQTQITIQKLLKKKNIKLDAGFVIKSKNASLMKMNALDKVVIALDKQRKRLKTGDERLKEIVSVIEKQKKHKPETSSWIANIFGTMFHDYGINFFRTAAKSFHVKENCTGCGTCVRVCPRANVIMENGQPGFGDNCELCHACIQWCPEFAISHPDFDSNLPQYRHPKINVNNVVVNA